MKTTTRQLTLCAMLTALALALSWVERFLPLSLLIPLPGIKLGLANIVTLFALYALGPAQALLILLCRCTLGALFAGNLNALIYSLFGGVAAMLTMILLFTGMRISELFTLPVTSVHLAEPVPYLQGGLKTRAGRNRIIPIHRRILPFVRFFCARATGPLLVSGFCGNKRPDGWRARDYAKMLAALGIPYKVPHNTRRTMATHAAQEGVDRIALAKLMGWSDIAVGNKYYIAPDVAYLAAEMEKLDGWDVKLGQK